MSTQTLSAESRLSDRLDFLRREYFAKQRELTEMEQEMRTLRDRIESECVHEWVRDDSARGGRSYHLCAKCGAYR